MTPKIARLQKRLNLGRPVVVDGMTLVHTKVEGVRVVFCTNMENDPIQRNHRRGRFYEHKELKQLRDVFPEGGTFIDIGANVGNHSLYAAMFLKAGKVVPFEPNPKAFVLLAQNVLLNRVDDIVDFSRLGVGLSDKTEDGFAMQAKTRNLGSAKMLSGKGNIAVHPADDLLDGETPDLIKIDVEGMEMQVLGGLEKTIATHKPKILIEVDNTNEEAFMAWADAAGYDVAETTQRYRLNKNHLLVPRADAKTASSSKTRRKPAEKKPSGKSATVSKKKTETA